MQTPCKERLDKQKQDSCSGHRPRLWVQSPVRAHTRGNQSMFFSQISFSPPSFSLSLKLISLSSGEDLKKRMNGISIGGERRGEKKKGHSK